MLDKPCQNNLKNVAELRRQEGKSLGSRTRKELSQRLRTPELEVLLPGWCPARQSGMKMLMWHPPVGQSWQQEEAKG
jgi:hypothetical protein